MGLLRTRSALRVAASLLACVVSVAGFAGTAAPATATPGCASSVNVVAHQDDDLLFMNPAISDDIAAGGCVTTVFVTAGDAGRGRSYWRERERGAMAAYARMAGRAPEWTEDRVSISGRSVARATLDGSPITLLFLRLPDRVGGWPLQTVQQLWLSPAAGVRSLDTHQTYRRGVLLDLLTRVMTTYQPDTVRTLDFEGAYGDGDHDDHHSAAYFTYAAQQRYTTPHTVTGYLGYGVANRPENLTAEQREIKTNTFLAYAAHDFHVCQTAEICDAGSYRAYFTHSVPVAEPVGLGRNVAGWAVPTASSEDVAGAQTAGKIADGRLGSARLGEWATRTGKTGSWIRLTWPTAQRLGRIVLHDRVSPGDRVLGGTLTFSDGSSIRVGALPNDGAPLAVSFSPRDVTSVTFTITRVSPRTWNAGLAELRAISAA